MLQCGGAKDFVLASQITCLWTYTSDPHKWEFDADHEYLLWPAKILESDLKDQGFQMNIWTDEKIELDHVIFLVWKTLSE